MSVNQSGRTRSFGYDPLGRMTSATNPESGTAGYTYDSYGNAKTRTDARGIQTSYSYDALNRLQQVSYGDGTPTVTYSYDTAVNGKGYPASVMNSNSATNYTGYDALGNVTVSGQQSAGSYYTFSYTYNLAGVLTNENYPSGRAVTTSYDAVDRANGVTGAFSGQGKTYVNSVSYLPHGSPYKYTYGNQLTRTYWSFSPQLQPLQFWDAIYDNPNYFLFIAYPLNWGTTNNNGNLQGGTYYEGGPAPSVNLTVFNRTYGYDTLNRLTSASDSGGWSRSFAYDTFGNMYVSANSGVPLAGNTPTANVFNAKNQINGTNYDLAGNQTTVNGDTMGYDAENRQISAYDPTSQATETYAYDGAGQRVMRVGPSGTTLYVYDAFGQLAAEYASGAALPSPCATCYLTYDELGSVRLVTDANANVIARHDYLPFGEEIPNGWAYRSSQWGAFDNVEQRFTGQVRDSETGVDFFNARYFGAALGRFTSPDPGNAGADMTNPQSPGMRTAMSQIIR